MHSKGPISPCLKWARKSRQLCCLAPLRLCRLERGVSISDIGSSGNRIRISHISSRPKDYAFDARFGTRFPMCLRTTIRSAWTFTMRYVSFAGGNRSVKLPRVFRPMPTLLLRPLGRASVPMMRPRVKTRKPIERSWVRKRKHGVMRVAGRPSPMMGSPCPPLARKGSQAPKSPIPNLLGPWS